MAAEKQIDVQLISRMIWWAETRITGNYGDGDECTEEERLALIDGLKKIKEHFYKISKQLAKMRVACQLFGWDCHCAINAKQLEELESMRLFELRSKGGSTVEKLIRQNQEEEKGVEVVSQPYSACDPETLVVGMASDDKESFGNWSYVFQDNVFRNRGFRLAVKLGDDVVKAYLRELAGELFDECDTDAFGDVLLKLHRRRQKKQAEGCETSQA